MSDDNAMENISIPGPGNFQFSGLCTDLLEATEYTLVSIIVDRSGSVSPFSNDIDNMLEEVIKACAKSPSPENLLIRQVDFGSQFMGGLREVHGFVPLSMIPRRNHCYCTGGTPLYDAIYSSIEATLIYSETKLVKNGYTTNGILFIITDGDDTGGSSSPKMIRARMEEAIKGEKIESLLSILIGVNDINCKSYLEKLSKEGNLSQYISVGDVTPQKLAKLATFVSKSISSQAQMRGSGGPSQTLTI